MTQAKASKPDFYKTLMQPSFYKEANKTIKFQESTNFWIFKTGKEVYKVKKKSGNNSTISLDELFCRELQKQSELHSPDLGTTLYGLRSDGKEFFLDENLSAENEYCVLVMAPLSDRYFLNELIEKGRLTHKICAQIAGFLYNFHQKAAVSTSKTDGTAEHLNSVLQNLYYQSKKHLGKTITQPIIDLTFRPLERFLEDNRKLILRRIRKECIRAVHGEFVPRKINVPKEGIFALGRTSNSLKDRFQDVASDLADLTVELSLQDQRDFAEEIISKYYKLSGDRDLKQIVPFYQAQKCLANGLTQSIQAEMTTGDQAKAHQELAVKYYEQMVEAVRKF